LTAATLSSTEFACFWDADVVLRLYLLFVHVWIGIWRRKLLSST
jgi:hypothetical protein